MASKMARTNLKKKNGTPAHEVGGGASRPSSKPPSAKSPLSTIEEARRSRKERSRKGSRNAGRSKTRPGGAASSRNDDRSEPIHDGSNQGRLWATPVPFFAATMGDRKENRRARRRTSRSPHETSSRLDVKHAQNSVLEERGTSAAQGERSPKGRGQGRTRWQAMLGNMKRAL